MGKTRKEREAFYGNDTDLTFESHDELVPAACGAAIAAMSSDK